MVMLGSNAAKGVLDFVRSEVKKMDRPPKLACVIVGNDAASERYVRNKQMACAKVGIESTVVRLPADVEQMRLMNVILTLNGDREVDGILIQQPFPEGVDKGITECILTGKDVDGVTSAQLGWLALGREQLAPCTAAGIMRLLRYYMIPLAGKNVAIIGRSHLVGRPLAVMMERADATVTLCHSKTQNLADITRRADIVVCAVGKAGFLTADMISDTCVLVDVGINHEDGKVVGDCTPEAYAKAESYTPVPGGVGKMTVAELMHNTLMASKRRRLYAKQR